MSIRTVLSFCIIFLLFTNCGSDDEQSPDNENSEILQILSFTFLAKDNDNLTIDVSGTIDHVKKEITVLLPANTSVERLKPIITVSEGMELFPRAETPRDFTSPFEYSVLGENSVNVVDYTVIVSVTNSDESNISEFRFLTSDNPSANLITDIAGTIEGNTIKVEFASATDISSLTPVITVSNGATIVPNDDVAQDFTKNIEYIVTAQDGVSKTVYTVQATKLKSDDDRISGFTFSNIGGNSYSATIEEDKISLILPVGTAINNLTPTITIGNGASVVPENGEAQNFNTILSYEVTAENGDKRTYMVNIYTENSLRSDRAVLENLYKTNLKLANLSRRYLNWDLQEPDMSKWEGVTIKDDRVTALDFPAGRFTIYDLTSDIGKLSELEHLFLTSINLTEIPKEIGALKKLEYLNLAYNQIRVLPIEIGDLEVLESLYVFNNELSTLPIEIRELSNLNALGVNNNNITQIPVSLSETPELLSFNLIGNPISIIPKEICDMKTQSGFPTQVLLDADDTCE